MVDVKRGNIRSGVLPETSEYSELARLPLRRPAMAVNAPSLSWHFGMRMSSEPAHSPGADAIGQWRLSALRDLNTCLLRLQQSHKTPTTRLFAVEGAPPGALLVDPRDTLFLTVGKFGCVRLRLCVNMHEEYYTLTLLADGFHECTEGAGFQVREILAALDGADCISHKDGKGQIHDIYDTFWNDMQAKVAGLDFRHLPGAAFVNLRGMAICPPHIGNALTHRNARLLQLPSHEMTEHRRKKIVDNALVQFVDRRPHLFAAALGMEAHDAESAATDDVNGVLCGMLDGAAIFGTGLKPVNGAQNMPLRYFLLYDGFSSMQLGRLMRRLHVLAELRMAALVDLKRLRDASDAIRAAGYDEDLGSLNNTLRTIAGKLPGGLSYRVSQSRYYAGVYRERLQDLRIVRIEGWQPYDEYVRRTVFRDFNFVDQIGVRFEALAARTSRISDEKGIESIKKNQDTGIEIQRDLRKLQIFAEPIGAIAFAYYSADMLMKSKSILPGSSFYVPKAYFYVGALAVYAVIRFVAAPLFVRRLNKF
jgi:uncharacterized protein DUF3422